VIILYRAPFSTNVERVALALAHKGLAVESVVISYDDRSEVERVSGQGLVPVVDDGGTVISDSATILEHLEGAYPEPPLYPADLARRAEVRVFIDWFNRVWKLAPNELEAELAATKPDSDRVAALAGQIAAHLDVFDELLAVREHLMGDDFSAADCVAFPFLKYALWRDPDDDELFHRVLDDYQRLEERHARLDAWLRRVDERARV
jgi:glutathione S-transferase